MFWLCSIHHPLSNGSVISHDSLNTLPLSILQLHFLQIFEKKNEKIYRIYNLNSGF